MIPKFLLADNSQDNPDRLYVVHTKKPAFVIGFDIEEFTRNQEIIWFDKEPDEDTAMQLLAEASDFLEQELDNQEDIFDE